MAEGGHMSFSSFKEQFDDQLTCGVCLGQYTNPKTLPCHHSFCLKCIERIPVEIKDGKYYISCPTCRVDHLLPQGGTNSLPNAFYINSLLDLRKKLYIDQNLVPNEMPMATQSTCCSKHNSVLKVYCETCCQVICRDCTISTEHNKHTFYLISECYPKHHRIILENIIKSKRITAKIDKAIILLDTREKEVIQQGENVKELINAHAQQLTDNIQRSRTHLTQQVDTIVRQKTQTLAAQRQQAQKLQTQLKTCQDKIEKSFKKLDQQQILAQKETMMDEMNTATQHVDPAVFQPIEDADIKFKAKGEIKSSTYGKATLEVPSCVAEQISTATLTLHSHDGSPFSLPSSLISSTLSSPGKHSLKCSITQIQPGKYNITFTPSVARNDQLIVQVGGVDVPGCPFTLPEIPTPEMKEKPVNIIEGLSKPWGIAVCDNGDIVIVEKDTHRVTIISGKTQHIRSLEIDWKNPAGIAMTKDGHILVTDNHRLQKLTIGRASGSLCIKSVGSSKSGCGQLQFHYPMGIEVHPITGQIFVADSLNNRIQVFNNDLTFSHTISSLGFFNSFKTPCDIAIGKGHLYVTEYRNHCITKLTYKGKYIKRFGSHGSAPGQIIHPFYLALHNDLIYVTDTGNNRVSIFDSNGNFLCFLDSNISPDKPRGIAIDGHGNLYIADFNNGKIIRTSLQ